MPPWPLGGTGGAFHATGRRRGAVGEAVPMCRAERLQKAMVLKSPVGLEPRHQTWVKQALATLAPPSQWAGSTEAVLSRVAALGLSCSRRGGPPVSHLLSLKAISWTPHWTTTCWAMTLGRPCHQCSSRPLLGRANRQCPPPTREVAPVLHPAARRRRRRLRLLPRRCQRRWRPPRPLEQGA